MFPFLVSVLTVIIIIGFIPPIQERYYWIKYVGVRIIVSKFDVDDGVNLCWLNLLKDHINPSFNPWSSFKGFNSRILKPWLQNIYGSNLPNRLYTTLHIRDITVDTYSIVHWHWPKAVENVSLWNLRTACINMVLSILTTILMVRSAAQTWCEAQAPLNLIFCCFSWGIGYSIVSMVSLDQHSMILILPLQQ